MIAKWWDLLVQYRRELILNPLPGMWSMVLQRLTGVGIVFYLLMHIVVIGSVAGGPGAFDESMARVQNPVMLFKPLEFILMVVLLLHALNGIRITVLDFGGLSRQNKVSVAIMTAVFVPLAAVGGWIFLSHMLHHG
ncbi:MAG: succinate dehydrogenase, cytochrome b556 subunit [Armatimonadia bacterium]|nr:succinate dehydrogenase, cytochrome b556 subunit [Armatimonadia bacterium]